MSSVLYQPLDRSRREIRLIVLEDADVPTNGQSSAGSYLKCEMIITSLDLYKEPLRSYPAHGLNKLRNVFARTFLDAQTYSKDFYALSYVWGNPAAVCDIEINGIAAKIGETLHAALQAIRKNTKFRVIWADALCINQNDMNEKSWQVQEMASIYSRARSTISWLGPSSEDSDLALESLAELDGTTSRVFWSIQEAKEGGPPPSKVKKGTLQILNNPSSWNAISKMCARPYWSRIWIFQEMACARDRYYICGDSIAKEIDRPIAFLLAWQVTEAETSRPSLDPRCMSMVDSVQTFRFHGNFPADAPYYIRPGTLHDMLLRLKDMETTEIREKIYAPLGVATDKERLGIVPDYTKDLETIFTETACALIRAGSLGVLVTAGSQNTKNLQLPSWVPDWSTNLTGDFNGMYRADKDQYQRLSTLQDVPTFSTHVALDGYIVGKISWIHEACPETALAAPSRRSTSHFPTFSDWLDQFEVALASASGSDDTNKNPKKSGYHTQESAIAELLCAVGGQRPVWSLLANPYLQVYQTLKSANSLSSLLEDLKNSGGSRSGNANLLTHINQIHGVLSTGSRPYLTESGAMGLTWGDKDRVDDVVVIIPGALMPLVLRPISGERSHYQLIGVTYVHGIMDGEFFSRIMRKKASDVSHLQSLTLH